MINDYLLYNISKNKKTIIGYIEICDYSKKNENIKIKELIDDYFITNNFSKIIAIKYAQKELKIFEIKN